MRTASVGTFTTRAAPPLIAEDGFELAADGSLQEAQVVSGSGWPIIVGSRSLDSPVITSPGTIPPLSLRIALAPGDVAVRFSYRVVASAATSCHCAAVTLVVGTAGGSAWMADAAETARVTRLLCFSAQTKEPGIYLLVK